MLWQRSGRGSHARSPWNAAFATLLLGGIITLIWRGQEVPDAVLDERPAGAQSAPAAVATAPALKAPLPTAVPAPAPAGVPPAPTPVPALEAALGKAPPPGPQQQRRDLAVPTPAPTPAPATAAPMARSAAPAEPALRCEAPALEKRELPPGGGMNAEKSLNDLASAPQELRSQGMAAPPPAPAPAQSQVPPTASGATGPAGSIAERIARNDSNNRRRAAMFPLVALQTGDWVAADVLYQGRTTRLARLDAQNLVNRALGLVATHPAVDASARALVSASTTAADKAPAADRAPAKAAEATVETAVAKSDAEGGAPTLRLQLLDQTSPAVPVAQLELRGTVLRLQRKGQADVLGMLTPEAAAGLLAEAARALPP